MIKNYSQKQFTLYESMGWDSNNQTRCKYIQTQHVYHKLSNMNQSVSKSSVPFNQYFMSFLNNEMNCDWLDMSQFELQYINLVRVTHTQYKHHLYLILHWLNCLSFNEIIQMADQCLETDKAKHIKEWLTRALNNWEGEKFDSFNIVEFEKFHMLLESNIFEIMEWLKNNHTNDKNK